MQTYITDLAAKVNDVIKQRDEAIELCREMLATLSLPQNRAVVIGAELAQQNVQLWRNRWEKIQPNNTALGAGWIIEPSSLKESPPPITPPQEGFARLKVWGVRGPR